MGDQENHNPKTDPQIAEPIPSGGKGVGNDEEAKRGDSNGQHKNTPSNAAKPLMSETRFFILSIIFDGLLFAATGTYAYFAYQQVAAINDSITQSEIMARYSRVQAAVAREALKESGESFLHTLDQMKAQSAAQDKSAKAAQTAAKAAADQVGAIQNLANQAGRSADVATKQLELLDRPWIKVTGLKLLGPPFPNPYWFTTDRNRAKDTLSMSFQVSTKNVGKSTALNVHTYVELYFLLPAHEGFVGYEEHRFCDSLETRRDNPVTGRGTAMFPGDPQEEIEEGIARATQENLMPDSSHIATVLPAIIGCVDYQFQSSPVHHQTRFAYRIQMIEVGQNFDAGSVTLEHQTYADYAY